TPDIMPFVHVRGTWGEMGAQVGQMFAPLIERHVEAWLEHVARETGAGHDDALATAASYAAPIQAHAPFLWEELEGMARGSRLPMDRLLLLQARAEVMRLSKARAAPPPLECTTFAVGGRRTANQAVLYGQNVDLVPFLSEYGVVVRQYPKDAPATLLYTTAGLLGHNGLNEAGVGICANFINDPAGWGEGLPRHLLSRLAPRPGTAPPAPRPAPRAPRGGPPKPLLAGPPRWVVS